MWQMFTYCAKMNFNFLQQCRSMRSQGFISQTLMNGLCDLLVLLFLHSLLIAAALPHHALDSDCEPLQTFVQVRHYLDRLQQNKI